MKEELVIGVDVGYGNTKTANVVFASGVTKLPSKPSIGKGIIENSTDIYSIGNSKTTIQESKTTDENMLILTEAAIAEELKLLGITSANVHLGVGVPLTRMGAEKDSFLAYYNKNRHLVFRYDDVSYDVTLLSVHVFPQGYSGITDRITKFARVALVIDIGSWTVDILPFKEQSPDLTNCNSLKDGTIGCIQKINEKLRSMYGEEVDDIYIKDIMIHGKCDEIPKEYSSVIQQGKRDYIENLMGTLRALKFNLKSTQLIFIGGGASIVKNFWCKEKYPLAYFIEDIHINAKGYERTIRYLLSKGAIR